jgi:hypothetical protein
MSFEGGSMNQLAVAAVYGLGKLIFACVLFVAAAIAAGLYFLFPRHRRLVCRLCIGVGASSLIALAVAANTVEDFATGHPAIFLAGFAGGGLLAFVGAFLLMRLNNDDKKPL